MKLKKVFQILGVVLFITAAGIASYHQIAVHKQPEADKPVLIIYDQPEDKESGELQDEPENEAAGLYQETEPDIKGEDYAASLEMLAICVEAEAGNQSIIGKRLVVDVILNRVDDPDFPNTIEEVISQKYQFSSYWDGGMERHNVPSEETYKAVQMELEHRSYPGLFYFTAEGFPKYGTPWKKIGDHYFSTK